MLTVVTDGLMSEESMCTFILPFCDMDKWEMKAVGDRIKEIIEDKPPVAQRNEFVNVLYDQYSELEEESKVLKIVLINDVYVDFEYKAG